MPPLLRSAVEDVLVRRCRNVLARAGMATTSGPAVPNGDLDDPIAAALEGLGIPPQDRTAVTDADLAPVVEPFQAQFLDLATIRTLETALRQMATLVVRRKLPDVELDYSDVLRGLRSLVDGLWEQYQIRYARSGTPAAAPMGPAIRHGFDPERFYPNRGGWGGIIIP